MTLVKINFENEYRTNSEFDPKTFYKLGFNNSSKYRRASGYFSTSIYHLFKKEVFTFIEKGGVIELLCSPIMSEKDIDIISNGYELKEKYEKIVSDEVKDILNDNNIIEEVDFISTLIKFNKLIIKIIFLEKGTGIFHEKAGYFADKDKNIASFSGSMNESYNGVSGSGNYERIKVFQSWKEGQKENVISDTIFVDDLWNNTSKDLRVINFPDVPRNNLIKRAKNDLNIKNFPKIKEKKEITKIDNLLDYQKLSIDNWKDNNYKGILKHATGSGKTITALYAVNSHIKQGHPALIIVPSKLLLEQWYEEIQKEIPDVLVILRCGGGHIKWRTKNHLNTALKSKNNDIGAIIIAVTVTASSPNFKSKLMNIGNTLLVVDEVHVMGTKNNLSIFEYDFLKRLGLSATPERYNDPEGTEKIIQFFNGIIDPEIDIKYALEKGRLVKYEYYPKVINLTSEEEDNWEEITDKIIKHIRNNK